MRTWVAMAMIAFTAYGVQAATQKDPTRPANSRLQVGEEPVLQQSERLSLDAIFVTGTRRIAIINGVTLSEGEQYFDAKLIKIEKDSVIVEQEVDGTSQQRTIRVNSTGEIKKNASNNF